MIKKFAIFITVIACLSVEINAEDCPFYNLQLTNVTETFTYSYLVKHECRLGELCPPPRWETKEMNKTVEKTALVRNPKCCERPGSGDGQSTTEDRITMPLWKCIPGEKNTRGMDTDPRYNVRLNYRPSSTPMQKVFQFSTSTKKPQITNTGSVEKYMGNVTYREENNGTVPSYRTNTTSKERNYNGSTPSNSRYTTSTEKSYSGPTPVNSRYMTSTERKYNGPTSANSRYTTSTEKSYSGPTPANSTYTTSTERNHYSTTPAYRAHTNSTERRYRWHWPTRKMQPSTTKMNTAIPKVFYKANRTRLHDFKSNVTDLIGSLPDLNPPYTFNNPPYKTRHGDGNVPFTYTTPSTHTTSKTTPPKTMCPKQRRILILITIVLAYTALCVTLLIWRRILLKRDERRSLNSDEDSQGGANTETQVISNAPYALTEERPVHNSIYPSISEL